MACGTDGCELRIEYACGHGWSAGKTGARAAWHYQLCVAWKWHYVSRAHDYNSLGESF